MEAAARVKLCEETTLACAGTVADARRVRYPVPGDAHTHAVVQVFDGQADGVGAALGAGLVAPPYPEGNVQVVEPVPLAAIESLSAAYFCGVLTPRSR